VLYKNTNINANPAKNALNNAAATNEEIITLLFFIIQIQQQN
jgi:hypothetical protein